MINARQQGYLLLAITMCIWGGFTLSTRLSALWGISAWDLVALRFMLAFCLLMPVLLYRKDTAFLWTRQSFILAMIGGVGYCLTAYSAFHFVPAAHAAIFLNGCIPLCTPLAAWLLFRQPFDRHTWISVLIMLLAIAAMSLLMYQETGVAFGFGDLLFFLSALWWGVFTVLLRQWKLSAWHSMASVAIWSALVYVPIYWLFFPKNLSAPEPLHLIGQTLFHGIFVVIIATLSYVEAIKRLGAFKAGSIVTLAPFIAAILAVPLLNEPLSLAIVCGLLGMGIGALQPWRWWGRKDSLSQQIERQNKPS
ncbi:DMT family transporter [Acinetobacter indicus]|uniref:DMT family transporter n=1 Tax=Acinetobacter indicus TaxID=756892 RepID=UPI00148D547D|nr:DMT family transporter [Acinetobacter indicus]NOJ68676.1 DMT family transporter [Acinetobacter indicus]